MPKRSRLSRLRAARPEVAAAASWKTARLPVDVHAVFGWVFDGLGRHRIHASVDPRNLPSVALLRRLGMRQEACHLESLWLHGEWVDDVIFAMLEREWQASPAARRHRG